MAETPPAPPRPRIVAPDGTAPPETPAASARGLVFQGLLALGGLALLVILVVERDAMSNPFILAAVGAALLWPVRRERAGRAILLAGGLLLSVYVLRTLAGVLAPFVGVFVLAYLLDPAVAWAERRWGLKRWVSAAALTAVAVGVLAAAVLLLVPAIAGQIEALAASALDVVAGVPQLVADARALDGLERAGLVDRETLVAELAAFLPEQVQALAGRLPSVVVGLTRSVGAVIGVVTVAALLPVLLFYTLKDFPVLRDGAVSLLPRYRGRREYLERVAHVFGSYLRGQLTISALSAVLVAVPLALFGVPFSILLGMLAGVLNMIPNLGSILTYVLSVLLMLVFGTWGDVVIVLVVLAVQAIIEQAVLTPQIMSEQVGLHPVVVMVSLFAFSAFFGIVGFIIAVPTSALIAMSIRAAREDFVLDFADETPAAVIVPTDAA